jgi:uncharacterized membrane protein YcaP (DUF421 family)
MINNYMHFRFGQHNHEGVAFLDYIDHILKTIVSISVLFVLTRFIGKKQLAQMNYFDYVSGITFGAVAAVF